MLIIEGPDCSGKTTFAKKCVKRLNEVAEMSHTYAHLSRLPDSFDRYWDYYARAHTRVVQDRFHMSEPVYEVGRGEEPGSHGLYPDKYRLVDSTIGLLGAYTVVLYMDPSQSIELIESRWNKEEMYDSTIVDRVNAEYAAVCRGYGTWHGYKMNVDAWFPETYDNPFPDDAFLDQVLQEYVARQNLLALTVHTRETCDLRR